MLQFFQSHLTETLLIASLLVIIPFVIYYVTVAKREHPKGLIAAALSNMGERFGLKDTQATAIYSVFYMGIYILSLVGGIIADRTQNYKGTIMSGLIVMALGYVILAVPILATTGNIVWLLPLTSLALFSSHLAMACLKGICKPWWGSSMTILKPKRQPKVKKNLELPKANAIQGSRFSMFLLMWAVWWLLLWLR